MAGLPWLILRRLIAVPFVILGVTLVVFVATDLAPNDPATAALGAFSDPAAKEKFAEENGLNDPLLVRYGRFVGDLAQGDLGSSVVRPQPVWSMIEEGLPVTIQLTAMAMFIAVLLAVTLGTLAALNREGRLDTCIRAFSAGGVAVPDFWLGIVAIQFIAVKFQLLPSGGYVPFSQDPALWLESLILPALVLAIPVAAVLTAVVRSSVARELERDYVRTARGSGLPRATVIGKHVLRNAMLAPLTVIGVRAGYLLGGAIIIESIFNLPGLGTILIEAIQSGDLAPVRGVAIVGAVMFVLVNLVVDLLYMALNPKLRHAAA